MSAKKKKPLNIEIRIVNPSDGLYEKVKKIAEQENRSIPAQADWMLKQYIKEHKL